MPMLSLLGYMLKNGVVTATDYCPDLEADLIGLPKITSEPCLGTSCNACESVCPTAAIKVSDTEGKASITLDRGACIGCSMCVRVCTTGTIQNDTNLKTASLEREDLILSSDKPKETSEKKSKFSMFRNSIAARVVSTGCSACDLELNACNNPIFDIERFGVHVVASPRFADVLLVTGPVPKAMHEPLQRCYEAMPDPRMVVAVGTCAISGGVHKHGYAEANGVANVLPVDAFIPGCPPHPWTIIDGIRTAMKKR